MATNQEGPPGAAPGDGDAPETRAGFAELPAPGESLPPGPDARAAAIHAAEAVAGTTRVGLLYWTVIVFTGSLLGILTGRADAALFLAVAALFALTQAWDARDRARTGDPVADVALMPGDVGQLLRLLVPLLAPIAGAVCYASLAAFAMSLPPTSANVAAMRWSIAAAAVSLALGIRPVAQLVAGVITRRAPPSYTARLTASIALVLLMMPVPVRLMFDEFLDYLTSSGRPLADIGGLLAQLAGEVLFALAAVGLWVARDARAVRDRLGLGRMGPREWLVAAFGLAAVIGVNFGMEWLERERFHDLWLADQAMGKLIVGNLSLVGALALGVSAGVGEELLVRGALQPRSGLVWAAVLFASAHVQYTWFGMLTILMLGIVLGLVKQRANTTAAIVVHVAYDIFAVLGTPR